MILDLEICILWNRKFKDEGVKNLVKGIPTHNNLIKLHLNFSDCNLSHKSGVSISLLLRKLSMAEDLKIILCSNKEFKDEGIMNTVQGIPTHNNLKKLHLNFSDCVLSYKSGVFIG